MFDYNTIRLAQIITEERIAHLHWREPSLVFSFGGFRWHRRLLSHLATVLIHVRTKVEVPFRDHPKRAVSRTTS